nr:helix-turn-helix transcriptional regulator [Fictibacillus barbaricus]
MKVKLIRKSLNLTQEELAERAHFQASYLAGIERGERNITLETLEKIANALEISPQDLFHYNDLVTLESDNVSDIEIIKSIIYNRNSTELKMIKNILFEITKTIDSIKK